MKNEIIGQIVAYTKETKKKKGNYSLKVILDERYHLFWKISDSTLLYSKLPDLKVNDSVTVIWDDVNYTAKLKLSDVDTLDLVRDFSKRNESETQKPDNLLAIHCPSCGSNVPLEYKDEAVCLHCMTKIGLNPQQTDAVKKSKEILKANQNLFEELNAIFLNRLNPRLFKTLSLIPLLLLAIQIMFLSFGTFMGDANDFISDEIFNDFLMEDYNFGLWVVLPSILISIGLVFFTRKNAYSIDISYLYAFFSPKVSGTKKYTCRNCGSPLDIYEIPQMTVCSYCQTENIAMGNTQVMSSIFERMNINYLIDIKIMHNEFRKKYSNYFWGVMTGLIFFYGIFLAYAMQWDDIEDVSFVIHYIIMPFSVLILIHFLCQIAALPYLQFNDWLPKYFKENISQKEIVSEEQRPFILRAMPYIQHGLFLLFFITLFFMRK